MNFTDSQNGRFRGDAPDVTQGHKQLRGLPAGDPAGKERGAVVEVLKKKGAEKMKKYYKDAYGCTASIKEGKQGFKLVVAIPGGKVIKRGTYGTFRGARAAMGRMSEIWEEVK